MADYDKNSTPQREATPAQQTRAYAGYYGLWVGLLWVLSFGLTIYGLRSPLAGNLGLLAGFCSLPLGIRLLRGFRDNIGPLPLRRAWNMAYLMFLAAALICTAAQYVYFAYFDEGSQRGLGRLLLYPTLPPRHAVPLLERPPRHHLRSAHSPDGKREGRGEKLKY